MNRDFYGTIQSVGSQSKNIKPLFYWFNTNICLIWLVDIEAFFGRDRH